MTEITTMEQLDDVIAGTERRPVFLYKHSTICPTSFGSKRRVTEYIAKAAESATPAPEFYLVNVIESRPISNAIAEKFGVPHKSPQLLLIDRGRCTWNRSHYEIDAENIDKALQSQTA